MPYTEMRPIGAQTSWHLGPKDFGIRTDELSQTNGFSLLDMVIVKKIYGCKDRKLFFAFFPFTPLLITKLQTIILDPIFQCNFQRKLLALHPRLDI